MFAKLLSIALSFLVFIPSIFSQNWEEEAICRNADGGIENTGGPPPSVITDKIERIIWSKRGGKLCACSHVSEMSSNICFSPRYRLLTNPASRPIRRMLNVRLMEFHVQISLLMERKPQKEGLQVTLFCKLNMISRFAITMTEI
jgi:hypothetical protein